MKGNIKHIMILKFKFIDSGYCKFGSHCRKRHFVNICPNLNCKTSDCQARHPKRCKFHALYNNCKFGTYCKFSHLTSEKDSEHGVIQAM